VRKKRVPENYKPPEWETEGNGRFVTREIAGSLEE